MSESRKTYSFGSPIDLASGGQSTFAEPPLVDLQKMLDEIKARNRVRNRETYTAIWNSRSVALSSEPAPQDEPPEWIDRIDGFEFKPNPAIPLGMICSMAKGIESMFPAHEVRKPALPPPGVTVLVIMHPEMFDAAKLVVEGESPFR